MKELYKVKNISISIFNSEVPDSHEDVTCEFGTIIENEGVIFLETYFFDINIFNRILEIHAFEYAAKGKMLSFDNATIEIPDMVLTGMTTKEYKASFKCFDAITVSKQESYCKNPKTNIHQLLSIDFWGLDLTIPPNSSKLLVCNAPFDINFKKDKVTGNISAYFPINQQESQNILTDEIFALFRDSLVGYLSLINGACVQITKENYNGYYKIFSCNCIESKDHSRYACGNAKLYRPSSILYEFDNYVRWNEQLKLNKFVYHLCSAQQLLYMEDRSFILILAFEGLCRNYENLVDSNKKHHSIISKEAFKAIKSELYQTLENLDMPSEACTRFKSRIDNINECNSASNKFSLILSDLNIQQTPELKNLTKRVRHILVHEATLNEYKDYLLLSELIREIILRLINSKVKRCSEFEKPMFLGEAPNFSFDDYLEKCKLNANKSDIIKNDDERIKLRIHHPRMIEGKI